MSSLFLSKGLLDSPTRLFGFFFDHKDFFLGSGMHFEAFNASGGFDLVPQEQIVTNFHHAQSKPITQQFFGACIHLLQATRVLYAVDNPQKYGTYLPPYLFWLTTRTSNTANILRVSQSLASSDFTVSSTCTPYRVSGLSQRALALKHTPSSSSLFYTFLLAAGYKYERLPMDARLILNVPSSTSLNEEQLLCVLNLFANSVRHYFKSLSYDFDVGGEETNYIFDPIDDPEARLEMLVRYVDDDQPYTILLKDMYFNEVFFTRNIHSIMKVLDGVAKPISFDSGMVTGYNIPCTSLKDGKYLLTLKVFGNTYCEYIANFSSAQFFKLDAFVLKDPQFYLSTETSLPKCSDYSSSIAMCFEKEPTSLYFLPQSSLAQWFACTSVDSINVACVNLLSRIQAKKPFTLPGSAQIIQTIKHIIGYILGYKSVNHKLITRVMNEKSMPILDLVRKSCLQSENKERKDALAFLYACCEALPTPKSFVKLRSQLLQKYNIVDYVAHDIPYPAYETACVITHSLDQLSESYHAVHSSRQQERGSVLYCDLLINRGILPLFLLQSEIDIPMLNRAFSLPLALIGITFDVDNLHDGKNMYADAFWQHDYLSHMFIGNTMLDTFWKSVQNFERRILIGNIELVRTLLLEHLSNSIDFLAEKITYEDLLKALDLLIFLLTHEYSGMYTNTRARILPSAFSHNYLEKIKVYFQPLWGISPDELDLDGMYSDFPEEFKKLLPLKGSNSLTYFVAYVLFDAILEQVQHFMPNFEALNDLTAEHLFASFEKKLASEEKLLYLYERNWKRLIDKGTLYEECVQIKSTSARLRALTLPHFQERVRKEVIDWSLESTSSLPRYLSAATSK